MANPLKVRWAIAAAIAKATHIRIDDQKELRITDNSSDGKSVTVQDPNYPEKTIKVDLDNRSLDSLKFWTMVPTTIPNDEPLADYYELLCYILATELTTEQGLTELKESVFKAWEDDAVIRGMTKNSAKAQMAYHDMPDGVYSTSERMREVLDDPNFLERGFARELAVCMVEVARALRQMFRSRCIYLGNVHPDTHLVLDGNIDALICIIHKRWCGVSGAEKKLSNVVN